MSSILKRWKKDFKSVFIIYIGMLIGILAISIGFSFFYDASNFTKELTNGSYKVNKNIIYSTPSKNIINFQDELNKIVLSLNDSYEVSIGSIVYPINRDIPLSDMPSIIPTMYNENIEWRPNIIYGRLLTLEESLSNEKTAVIGYELYKNLFPNTSFNADLEIDLYGTTYKIIGVIGRTKRYSPQNNQIIIPYKNYFDFYIEEPDLNQILIYIKGHQELINFDSNFSNLNLVDSPIYINDIRIPLKLIFVIGILLLLTTIINQSNLFSFWINNRKKELLVKKILGATNFSIVMDILKEIIFISITSTFLALCLQYFIQLKLNPLLSDYELKVTLLNFNIALLVSIIVSIISSIIPIRLILSMDITEELKK